MKILVCKPFGIGNAVLTIPLIKALVELDGISSVDVLVGSTHDDAGAKTIFEWAYDVDKVFVDNVPLDLEYDVAIEAIPYDGRWKNGIHYRAKTVLDGRTRPDPSDKKWGFHTWKKHEVLYMLENAELLGWKGEPQDCSLEWEQDSHLKPYERSVYLGMGYKKMPNNPWQIKHWGDDNFAKLINLLEKENVRVYTTTTVTDLMMTVANVSRMSGWKNYKVCSLDDSIIEVSRCSVFVGNDTGMMHVAAAYKKPVVCSFFMQNASIKNPPWMTKSKIFEDVNRNNITVDMMFNATMEMLDAVKG